MSDTLELDDHNMVEHLGTLKLPDESGESFDKLTVLNFPVDTPDAEVERYVAENFPVWRCTHSYDCCGHFYPRRPRWTRLHPQACRVIVSQGWHCNI